MSAPPPKKSRGSRSDLEPADEKPSAGAKHGAPKKHGPEKHADENKHAAAETDEGDDEGGSEKKSSGKVAHRPHKKRHRRILLRLFILVLLPTGGLVAGGPWLAVHCGLLDRGLTMALSGAGSIHVGSASINWWSPIVLNDVEIRDAQGQPLAEIGSLASDNPLWTLAFHSSSPGRFTVNQPALHLVLRDDGSNLEDMLGKLSQGSGSSSLPAVQLAVSNGKVTIEDAIAKRQFTLENLSLTLNMLGSSENPLEASGSAQLPSNGQSGVKFELHSKPQTDAAGSPLTAAQVICDVEAVPLTIAQPLLRRVLAGAQVAGQVTGKVQYTWGDGPQHNQRSLQGDLTVGGLALSAAALGGDQFQLTTLHAACQIVQSGVSLQFQQMVVESDIGQLNISGQARLDDLARPDVINTLAHETFQLTGQLDLAQVARLLPNTLRLRQGTQITAGSLGLSVTSAPAESGGRWQAKLEGSNLAGLDQGHPISWQAPLVIDVAAHDNNGVTVVDAAHCESSFLQANAAGTLENLSGDASFDLARLAAELGQFIDLSGVQLAGAGKITFTSQSTADQAFTAGGSAEAQNLQVAFGGRPAWNEPTLSAQFQAAGSLAGLAPKQIDKLSLQVTTSQDRFTADLAQSVTLLDARSASDGSSPPTRSVSEGSPPTAGTQPAIPLRVTWQGPTAVWLTRAALWCPVTGWDLTGDGGLSATVNVSTTQITADQVALSVDRFHLWRGGIFIDEPRVDVSAAGRLDLGTWQVDLSSAVATAGAASVQLSSVHCALTADKSDLVVAGSVTYKADATQLARWSRDPRVASMWNMGGQAAGQGQLKYGSGQISLDVDSTVDGFEIVWAQPQAAPTPQNALFQPVAAQAPPLAWREQRIAVALHAVYDAVQDLLQISQAQVAASAVRCAVSGTVAALSTQRNLDLKGEVEYDWQQLLPLLQAFVGRGVTIAGHETRPFALTGPWPVTATNSAASLQNLTGNGGFGWSSIGLFGMPVGQGEVLGTLSGGVIQFKPVDLAVSQGTIHINEQIRILPGPGELRLTKGRLVDQVTVTQDVCGSALKYVAPILAEVTRAEGTFSVDIDGGHLPFGSPGSGDVVGHLVTGQAQVQAGPIAQQFVLLARQIEALLLASSPDFSQPAAVLIALNNENVDFRLVGGRVYHRNLKFQVGALQVTTQGSVGLDESMEVLAEVGIAEQLIANRPLLSGLLNHPLQIPLTGTLSRPHLDLRVVEQLAAQTVRDAPAGVLNGLHNELQKLFGQ